jgi:hypothetical protein
MGRLTLNLLLSFAQFEREVIGERVRDKIAASKRKGLWVGGPVPLGYRCIDKKLEIVPEEAEAVRTIFTLYLELGSMGALLAELDRRGIRTKVNGCRWLLRFRELRRTKNLESIKMSPIPHVVTRLSQNQHVVDRLRHDLTGEVVDNEICRRADGVHPHVIESGETSRSQELIGQIEINDDIVKLVVAVDEYEVKFFLLSNEIGQGVDREVFDPLEAYT